MKSGYVKEILRLLFMVLGVLSISLFFFGDNKVEPDLWGHLKFGQDTCERLKVAEFDPYSYSSYGARWINHEWLAEALFYLIFKFAGSGGLIVFKVLTGLIIAFLIASSLSTKTRSFYLRLSILFICLSVMKPGYTIRPQLFTYLFFALLVFCIDRHKETGRPYWLYGIPLIALLWCNLHGGFIIGIGLLFVYLLFTAFQKKVRKELVIVSAFSLLATLLNPNGSQLWPFIIKAVSMPRPNITEWGAVSFSFTYLNYFIIAIMALVGILFSRIKRSAFEIVVLFTALIFSFYHTRHIVLFAILVALYMPKYINSFAGKWLERRERGLSDRHVAIALTPLFIIYFVSAVYIGKTNPLKIEIPQEEYPMDAIAFMKDNGIGGNIFSTFNWAQLCIKELSPTSKVFLDGRYETVYSDDLIDSYFEVLDGRKDYREYLKAFPETDIMFLQKFDSLASKLGSEWKRVYASEIAYIFLKDNYKNIPIITKYADKRLISGNITPPYYYE